MASKPEPLNEAIYKPGMPAPHSGVYTAIHKPGHRPSHYVGLRKGEMFPQCAKCEFTVFLLLCVAPYITEDADFSLPPS